MKRITTALFATAFAVAGVSCKSSDSTVSANPYEDNPYYGPQSTDTAATNDYATVTPAAPTQNYTAPAPAAPTAPAYTPPAAPAYTPPAAPANNYGGTTSHVVSKGDTLYSLSRRYGTTVAAIQAANGINDTTIVLGNTLNIPRG